MRRIISFLLLAPRPRSPLAAQMRDGQARRDRGDCEPRGEPPATSRAIRPAR